MKSKLRRYTSLPVLLDLLANQRLTLVSPTLWEDKNDVFLLERYKEIYGFGFLGAVCLTQASETFHHWKVFGSGNSGVCIEFDTAELQRYILPHSAVKMGVVHYVKVNDIGDSNRYSVNSLPFYKRLGFSAEEEVRIICGLTDDVDCFNLPIDPSCIKRVVASPFLPDPLLGSLQAAIQSIPDCRTLQVDKSRLIESKTWARNWKRRLANSR